MNIQEENIYDETRIDSDTGVYENLTISKMASKPTKRTRIYIFVLLVVIVLLGLAHFSFDVYVYIAKEHGSISTETSVDPTPSDGNTPHGESSKTTAQEPRVSVATETSVDPIPSDGKPMHDARDCMDHRSAGITESGVQTITIYGSLRVYHIRVFCDMETDGGGWTVLLRRQDGTVGFDRDWDEYVHGFGDTIGEYWIGNDIMHQITMKNGREYGVRFDLRSDTKGSRYAVYRRFVVGDSDSGYELEIGGYSGNAGDSMNFSNGCKFTTKDRDNDKDRDNCAVLYTGGWWYNSCLHAHLTGTYGQKLGFARGISWFHWLQFETYVDYADMKIR